MNPDGTVGIVLVSHSAALAEGAAQLAAQISGGTVAVVPAGGTDDGGLGTSAEKVRQAVGQADRGAGVVVLPDLGSAVLTVRALLADDDDLAASVELADAPFVEGAVAATVTAVGGANAKAVLSAAEEAWHARKF
ncbi:MAG: dihydroxyacetone kinase phosphoryl donor subunit DhaM [Streptosporangiaceae bacterium]